MNFYFRGYFNGDWGLYVNWDVGVVDGPNDDEQIPTAADDVFLMADVDTDTSLGATCASLVIGSSVLSGVVVAVYGTTVEIDSGGSLESEVEFYGDPGVVTLLGNGTMNGNVLNGDVNCDGYGSGVGATGYANIVNLNAANTYCLGGAANSITVNHAGTWSGSYDPSCTPFGRGDCPVLFTVPVIWQFDSGTTVQYINFANFSFNSGATLEVILSGASNFEYSELGAGSAGLTFRFLDSYFSLLGSNTANGGMTSFYLDGYGSTWSIAGSVHILYLGSFCSSDATGLTANTITADQNAFITGSCTCSDLQLTGDASESQGIMNATNVILSGSGATLAATGSLVAANEVLVIGNGCLVQGSIVGDVRFGVQSLIGLVDSALIGGILTLGGANTVALNSDCGLLVVDAPTVGFAGMNITSGVLVLNYPEALDPIFNVGSNDNVPSLNTTPLTEVRIPKLDTLGASLL